MKFLLVCLLTLGLLPMEMFAKGNNKKTTNTTQTTPANNEYSKTVACTSIWTYLLYDDGTFDNSYPYWRTYAILTIQLLDLELEFDIEVKLLTSLNMFPSAPTRVPAKRVFENFLHW